MLTQSKKQCGKSAVNWIGHILHSAEVFGRILESLSSLGRILWRSFHKKLVASVPIPFSLALLQLVGQSVSGEARSALEGHPAPA